VTADAHLRGTATAQYEAFLQDFIKDMAEWRADFVIDLGDFAIQGSSGPTDPQRHREQLGNLKLHWPRYCQAPCPGYIVLGNHDVGWINGGDEKITPEALYHGPYGGEHITKEEFLAVTKMPHRYYAFNMKGCHFIVLDGNNPRGPSAVPAGHDGAVGAYWIDDVQKAWLAEDLRTNRDRPKIVFCHEELHHTPAAGSGQGGEVPFPQIGKDASYMDNGWEIRRMFAEDGKVLACFFGHKHTGRWTVYDGTHYITLVALHAKGSYAKVTLSDELRIEGTGIQKSFALELPPLSRVK
jgi:alkaline phosphatase